MADKLFKNLPPQSKGYIIQKEEKRPVKEGSDEKEEMFVAFQDFHPMLFNQHKRWTKSTYQEIESFDRAIDLFFSSIESQKIDQKGLQQERDALKKLDNIKRDHEKRLDELGRLQAIDERKASLIQLNTDLVEKALPVMRSAVANQISWPEIEEMNCYYGPCADAQTFSAQSQRSNHCFPCIPLL